MMEIFILLLVIVVFIVVKQKYNKLYQGKTMSANGVKTDKVYSGIFPKSGESIQGLKSRKKSKDQVGKGIVGKW